MSRTVHRLKHVQSIRLQDPRRAPGGFVQHLLHRHLVARRRVLGDLEKTPATTSLAPPSPPLHLRTGKTTQLPAREGKPTVKTHSSRFERRAARGGGAEQRRASSWGWRRAREGEKQIGRCGAEKHRIAPPRSSIRIYGSRCVPSVRQLPAAASECP